VFSRIAYSIFDACAARPARVLLVSALVIVAALFALRQLQTDFSIYAVNPLFKSTGNLDRMHREFNDSKATNLVFASASERPLTRRQVCAIDEWIETEFGSRPEIRSIVSPFELVFPSRSAPGGDLSFRALLSPGCEHDADSSPFDFKPVFDSPWKETLIGPHGQDVMVQFDFGPGGTTALVGKIFESARARLETPELGLRIYISGSDAAMWHLAQTFRKGLWVNALAILSLVLIFRLFYGTWRAGALFALTSVLSTALVYAAMAALGIKVNVLSSNLFLMLCISGAEDFLFISYLHRAQGLSWRDSSRKVLIPGFLTSFTTFLGFLSLDASPMPIVRQFGVAAAVAALVEWGVTFFMLPALAGERTWVRPGSGAGWMSWGSRLRLPRGFSLAALAVFPLAAVSLSHIPIDDAPEKEFAPSHVSTLSHDYLVRTRGWRSVFYVEFQPGVPRAEIQSKIARIRALDNVGGVVDPYDVQDFYENPFSGNDLGWVRRSLKNAGAFKRQFAKSGSVRAQAFLKDLSLARLATSFANVQAVCGSACAPVGETVVYSDVSSAVVGSLTSGLLTSLLLVGFVILFLCWRAGLGVGNTAALISSAFWGPLFMILLMAVLRIPLNTVNSVFATVLVALAGDNAIQYLFAAEGGNLRAGVRARAEASMELSILIAVGSLCFVGLQMRSLQILGLLLFGGSLIMLVGDYWILQGLLAVRRTRPGS
jgi:predicted RND superfamily exporter protein